MQCDKEVSRLQKKVKKWLAEWLQNEVLIKNHFVEPEQMLQGYLSGEAKTRRLGSRSRYYHFGNLVKYEHAVLNEGQDGLEHLALAAHYAGASLRFEEAFADNGQNGMVLQDNAASYFSLAVLADWKDSAMRIGRALTKGLDTHLLDLGHNDRHRAGELYRHFWFVLHLYEQFSGDRFDTALYSYPADMSPYDVVLNDWRTTDLTKVHDWVCAMADFHVQETRNRSHGNIDEFDRESVMLFPYEILCWLRMREWEGLSNPEHFDHPLMQQPLARLPSPVPLPKPETPLLDQVIAKFRTEYPNSFQ